MRRSRAPLTLMEQLVMLAVFALAAAICLQTFVKADNLSREMEAADRAAALCQTAAESVRRTGSPQAGLMDRRVSGGNGPAVSRGKDGVWTVRYDADWTPIDGASAGENAGAETAYRLTVTPLDHGMPGLGRAVVAVEAEDGETLFRLETAWQEVSGDG